jgi:hypothetical protein
VGIFGEESPWGFSTTHGTDQVPRSFETFASVVGISTIA